MAFLAAQTIAGAVATATHGSTLMDGSLSNQVRSERHPRHLTMHCSSSQSLHYGQVMSSRSTIYYTTSIPQIRCVAADIPWQPYSLPCLGTFSSVWMKGPAKCRSPLIQSTHVKWRIFHYMRLCAAWLEGLVSQPHEMRSPPSVKAPLALRTARGSPERYEAYSSASHTTRTLASPEGIASLLCRLSPWIWRWQMEP